MDVFCVGMFRSGSTWQYDVASHLLERHRGAERLGHLTPEHCTPSADDRWRVLKGHQLHDQYTAARSGRGALALYSYRDLRDVCYSLMHKFRAPFVEVVERRRLLHRCL